MKVRLHNLEHVLFLKRIERFLQLYQFIQVKPGLLELHLIALGHAVLVAQLREGQPRHDINVENLLELAAPVDLFQALSRERMQL